MNVSDIIYIICKLRRNSGQGSYFLQFQSCLVDATISIKKYNFLKDGHSIYRKWTLHIFFFKKKREINN